MKSRYEDDHELGISAGDFGVHAWASTLKLWLRSLKEQIIIDSCYDEAIAIAAAPDGGTVQCVIDMLAKLPPVNQVVIQHLVGFLSKLDPTASKMTADNLAIVFAPCLFRHPDLQVAMTNSRTEIKITKIIIAEWEEIFGADGAAAEIQQDEEELTKAIEEIKAAAAAEAEVQAGGGDSDDD
eukprot:SAG22_NODE_1348_length_4662_cov_2.722113_4_plen_182_part_00